MLLDDLMTTTAPPCLYVMRATADELANLMLQMPAQYPRSAVRVIRGSKSRTEQQFFDEASAALQFPYYFGENWNAFDEVIVDLEWLPADAYLLFIADGHRLLADAGDEPFRILTEVLTRARDGWVTPNQYIDRGLPPTPFHVVFQCPDDVSLAVLTTRLARLLAAFAEISYDGTTARRR